MAHESNPLQSTDSGPQRRTLLTGLLGVSLAGWLATVLYPVLRYLSPLEQTGSADETDLNDKAKADIAAAGFSIVALGTDRVLVFKDPKGGLRALSAKCTHEGCTVQYKADESLIWCACHNGKFDLDGRVLSGPPPRPLTAFRASGSLDTKVVVSRQDQA
jgi:cytochrome b6-f complex iron-sulfur subunit